MPGLRAERATAKETSSTKACGCTLRVAFFFVGVARLLLLSSCSLFDLRRHSLRSCESAVKHFDSQMQLRTSLEQAANWVARPDVLVATADIYAPAENRDKIAELEQALARDNFHLFAGFQGATMLDARAPTHTHTHTYALAGFSRFSPPTFLKDSTWTPFTS